ncbi:sigma factor-like helix-turn-helix DNA-binding protein [Candidatus Accumulibacter sp. ACC007]|uniref:sigma factor-like helix-turn-helix DNA-binding protein n=1 Tax=Candidatus Accumulibacter sp. ACC007 TaxID=2823333 RepID=UPI00341286AF
MAANLRQRVTAVNGLLAAVYGEDTRLSVVLERLGASEQEIGHFREHAVAEACDGVVDAVNTCFQGLRTGNRDFLVLSRRLGLDGDVATLQEVGDELSVTRERVRQLEERARLKCRASRNRDAVEACLLEILALTRRRRLSHDLGAPNNDVR